MTKEEKREYDKKRYQANREKKLEYQKLYYKENKDKKKLYRQANREKILEQMKLYYQENKEKILEYYQTPIGRASYLLNAYNREDKKRGRNKGDLTAEWIVERIMSKPCAHCGKSGWEVIGCNRIDNSKPHTMDNVEPCCYECNLKLAGKDTKQVFQYSLDGKFVGVWPSTAECGRSGYNQGNVSNCCNDKLQKYKGYKWSYKPL